MLTYILDTDIDIAIDLEDFGVPNTVAPVLLDLKGEENQDDDGNTTTRLQKRHRYQADTGNSGGSGHSLAK
jgi:hypothetical protein